jgi:DNA-binding NarL/FixJ family response regulator
LVEIGAWDGAFWLIKEFERAELLEELLAKAIVALTKEGRLSTLREWLEYADRRKLVSPLVSLGKAELALRHGRPDRGGALAEAAASSLRADHPLLSLAHYRAGQSRHLADDSAAALAHFEEAYTSATGDADARNALWGQFIVACELETNDAFDLFDRLSSLSTDSPDDLVRAECGKLMLAICEGGRIPSAAQLDLATERAREAGDPLIRSALLRAVGALLVLGAEYEQALSVVRQALDEADHFHLGFVRFHTLVGQAAACIGLRRFGEAARALDEIEDASRRMRDPYLAANVDILRCRLFLSEGSAEAALEAVSGNWSRGPTLARRMEFAATRAAAVAYGGDPDRALDELKGAEGVSRWLEPDLLFKWVQSMCYLMLDRKDADDKVRSSYAATCSSRAFDPFVFVSRLHPQIVAAIGEADAVVEELGALVTNDRRQAHASISQRGSSLQRQLTRRESEVYALLAEGRSNREIAKALFISEPTVKVHVRHILRKLDARSRTEVAIRAARKQQPRAPADEAQERGSESPDPQAQSPNPDHSDTQQ